MSCFVCSLSVCLSKAQQRWLERHWMENSSRIRCRSCKQLNSKLFYCGISTCKKKFDSFKGDDNICILLSFVACKCSLATQVPRQELPEVSGSAFEVKMKAVNGTGHVRGWAALTCAWLVLSRMPLVLTERGGRFTSPDYFQNQVSASYWDGEGRWKKSAEIHLKHSWKSWHLRSCDRSGSSHRWTICI